MSSIAPGVDNSKLKGGVKPKGSSDIKTRVDSAEFKNTTGGARDVKLVAPSKTPDTPNKNPDTKPFYMKEQTSKDEVDDEVECTPEAQKKVRGDRSKFTGYLGQILGKCV